MPRSFHHIDQPMTITSARLRVSATRLAFDSCPGRSKPERSIRPSSLNSRASTQMVGRDNPVSRASCVELSGEVSSRRFLSRNARSQRADVDLMSTVAVIWLSGRVVMVSTLAKPECATSPKIQRPIDRRSKRCYKSVIRNSSTNNPGEANRHKSLRFAWAAGG